MKYLLITILLLLSMCNKYQKQDRIKDNLNSDQVKRVEPEFIRPKIIQRAQVIYPDSLRKLKVKGTVWVECLIDTFGNIVEAIVIRSDDERLNPFAIKTALSYKCSPAMINRKKMKWKITFPIEFR